MFPEITHIAQVQPIVDATDGLFIRHDPNGFSVADYGYKTKDTFETPLALECRGLKFDASGALIARPFHKFFNIGEREPPTQVDWSAPHLVMDKLDGSMVHGVLLNGEVVLMTRGGLSRHALAAQAIAQPHELAFMAGIMAEGWTPIFEFTAPDNRIVLAYTQARLTLLAIRHQTSGVYMTHAQMCERAAGLHVVAVHPPIGEILDFLAEGRAAKGIEGYVIAFDTGHRVKLKADDYALRHRVLERVTRESSLIELILEDALDDVIPLLSPEKASAVVAWVDRVEASLRAHEETVQSFLALHEGEDRKAIALAVREGLSKPLHAAVFAALDGKSIRQALLKLLDWTGQRTERIEQMRAFWDFSGPVEM